VDATVDECRALHAAMETVMRNAVQAGGRDTERGLHGRPGGYAVLLDTRTKGSACTVCGTAIEKISFLGGSCYFCPQCQG
jgi:formamidopyrimidine-DNA glycosylase